MSPRGRARAASAPAPTVAVARTRQRVLDALRALRRPATIAELAERVGIHQNTARFHLERLIADGRAERVPGTPRGPGRPATLVRAVPGMDARGARHYRLLAESLSAALADAPGGAELAEHAGHELGRRLAADDAAADEATTTDAVAALVRVLDRLDFAPASTGRDEIELRSCPFLELAGPAGGVACAVHLGLMRGALAERGADVAIASLMPFVTPERCVTRLRADA